MRAVLSNLHGHISTGCTATGILRCQWAEPRWCIYFGRARHSVPKKKRVLNSSLSPHFHLCLSCTKLLTWFCGSWDWLEHHWEPSIHSQGKKMEEREEEMDGCSQSLPAQKHSWLLQLTSWGSPWLKRNKMQRAQEAEMEKDAFPTMGLQGLSVWSEVKWKSIHDKCSASSNRVSTTARHGKQGACEDPRNVLWSFNGTRDFYFFFWYMVSDRLCTSPIVMAFFLL